MSTYMFIGKFHKGLDSLRVGFTPLTMGRYSEGPLGVTESINIFPNIGDYVMGMLEHVNKKEEQNR